MGSPACSGADFIPAASAGSSCCPASWVSLPTWQAAGCIHFAKKSIFKSFKNDLGHSFFPGNWPGRGWLQRRGRLPTPKMKRSFPWVFFQQLAEKQRLGGEKKKRFLQGEGGSSGFWLVSLPQPSTTCCFSPWSPQISASAVANVAQPHGSEEPKMIPPGKQQPGKSRLLPSFSLTAQKKCPKCWRPARKRRGRRYSHRGVRARGGREYPLPADAELKFASHQSQPEQP